VFPIDSEAQELDIKLLGFNFVKDSQDWYRFTTTHGVKTPYLAANNTNGWTGTSGLKRQFQPGLERVMRCIS
jgi:hypothetical protein